MDILFIHHGFPSQFQYTAATLARRPGVRVFAVGGPDAKEMRNVTLQRYSVPDVIPGADHPVNTRIVTDLTCGELAAGAMQALQRSTGCNPALVIGHLGWGACLFVKDIFPTAKLLVYCELFLQAFGSPVAFDLEFDRARAPALPRAVSTFRVNAGMLPPLIAADLGVSPTDWQKRQHPAIFQDKIRTVHDGINTAIACPNPAARFHIPHTSIELTPRDEVITFVSRNLEPIRGYHIFMRALPEILKRRPQARVLIVGDSGNSYSRTPPAGKTWKQIFLDEVQDRLDLSRVHFLGKIPKPAFISLLQVSSCHVYLTYPFVLSWSLIEAMAAGCLIVASSTAPVTEVLADEVTGRLVDFFDVPGLADRVADTLAERHRLAPLREAARTKAIADYDLATVCLPRQMALIDELVGQQSSAIRGNLFVNRS